MKKIRVAKEHGPNDIDIVRCVSCGKLHRRATIIQNGCLQCAGQRWREPRAVLDPTDNTWVPVLTDHEKTMISERTLP